MISTLVCALAVISNKGIQDGWAFDDTLNPILTPEVAGTMKDAGVGWVRLHFRLNATHPTWDEPILRAYDKTVATLRRDRLEILGLVTYESHPGSQKDWIANSAEVDGGNGDNPYIRDWASKSFRRLLARYPQVRYWEVWNEPNCWTDHAPGDKQNLPGGFYVYPSNFAWILRRASEEAHHLRPPRQIVSGGLLGADFTGDPIKDTAVPYLRETVQAGNSLAKWAASSYPVDVWGLHLYIRSGGLTPKAYFAPFPAAFQNELNKIDPRKRPIWLTEVGWQTDPNGLSEADQAKNVSMLFDVIGGIPQYGPIFYFKLRDEPAAKLNFGLIRADGTKKPAFDAFAQASR